VAWLKAYLFSTASRLFFRAFGLGNGGWQRRRAGDTKAGRTTITGDLRIPPLWDVGGRAVVVFASAET